jgi:acetylornithine deacetylase
MHIFELTRRLMEIESISGNEAAAGYFLRDYLSGLKYDVSLQEAAPNRFNVIAFAGKPELVFSTHIDTVPPYLPVDEDEEYLYGRGACDAKGIVAAQIEAAENLRASGAGRVGLLFVVGEERDSVGALAASKISPGSRFLIDGEPTDNHLALGSKGSLRVEISARGKAAHSAYPQMGESAILKLLDLLEEIRAMALPHDPILGESTCNIGVLEGGTKANIIPDSARAELMFRSVEPIELLKERLEILIAGRADSRYLFEVPPFIMQAMEGFETTVVSFASDAPFLTEWGKPFLLGPGSILNAHTDHERISKQELLEGVELYVRLARTLLS